MRKDEAGRLLAIGNQIRALRQARGMTLREAVDAANALLREESRLSVSLLSQIEKHGQATASDKLAAVVEALGGRIEVVADPLAMELVTEVMKSPEARFEIVRAFLQVLPHIPEEELDIFQHELRLWARRYLPK